MREDIRQEEKNMRRLRFIVDFTEALLRQPHFTLQESLDQIANAKKAALTIFPEKESVYDLIYTPRFRRILRERFTIPGSRSGRN